MVDERKSGNQQGNKKVTEIKTYSVPYSLGEIKGDFINTSYPSKLSSEKILNQAFILHSKGNILEAKKYYESFINQGFNDHRAFCNLGLIMKDSGKLKEAKYFTNKAIKLNPYDAKSYLNLGTILKDLGELDLSEKATRKSIELNSNDSIAHFNLGNLFKDLGKLDEADFYTCKAIELNPNFFEAKLNKEAIRKRLVPEWHMSMMNDYTRNNAYLEAIKLAVNDNKYILEIGTGSGLLAMMAVDAGAKKVITCETSQPISAVAKNIISKNGYDKKIKVINKNSKEITVGNELSEKADLIISEILSSEFVGEGIQNTIVDAKKRLLKENGKMIPESGEIRLALLELNQEIENKYFTGKINGYDLSEFNKIKGNKFNLQNNKLKPSLLSDYISPFSFDFYTQNIKSREIKIIELSVTKSGICFGLISWMNLNLYQDIFLENNPDNINNSHWSNPIYTFEEPLNVLKGQVIKIKAILLEDYVWYEFVDLI